jgi:RNA polymerase subunit RPABC4/transcription elongation factor Spt4
MKECKICGCGTDEKTEICITCQSKQWQERLGGNEKDENNNRQG